jgi:phosphoglycolate phosphatase-like HAD superfamily hydrolase
VGSFKENNMTLPCPARVCPALAVLLLVSASAPAQAPDPLPSWNHTPAKLRIRKFVEAVTDKASRDYVPPEQRVATFDNDGTLWTEQPMYVEVVFAVDRVRALADRHPGWKNEQPYRRILDADPARPVRLSGREMMGVIAQSHGGMTTEEFTALVKDWLATARHPRFKRPYTDLAYQPMVELLAYLRANGFKTYIVSGGGVEFMRTYAEKVYGIPPEQVVGTSVKTTYELRKDGPVLLRRTEFLFNDNYAGKPEGIERHIGRRPIAAFGNSDGDQQMLEWAAAGKGARLLMLVHHDDADREYAYDRHSDVGRLDKALDEARRGDWLVASMKKDWKVIYAFEKK